MKPLRSGELARHAQVSADTLRHYERLGILPAPRRTAAGYRLYEPVALERVRLIRRALAVGFTLKELVHILNVREKGGAPCHEVRSLAAAKLDELDARIDSLIALRKLLKAVLAQWDHKLARTPAGARAYLLEGLAKL